MNSNEVSLVAKEILDLDLTDRVRDKVKHIEATIKILELNNFFGTAYLNEFDINNPQDTMILVNGASRTPNKRAISPIYLSNPPFFVWDCRTFAKEYGDRKVDMFEFILPMNKLEQLKYPAFIRRIETKIHSLKVLDFKEIKDEDQLIEQLDLLLNRVVTGERGKI